MPDSGDSLMPFDDPDHPRKILVHLEAMDAAHFKVLSQTLGLPPRKELISNLRTLIDGLLAVPEETRMLVGMWLADQAKTEAGKKTGSFPEYINELRSVHNELARIASLPYPEYQKQYPKAEAKARQGSLLVQMMMPRFGPARKRFEEARIRFQLFQAGLAEDPPQAPNGKIKVDGDQTTLTAPLVTDGKEEQVSLDFHLKPIDIRVEKQARKPAGDMVAVRIKDRRRQLEALLKPDARKAAVVEFGNQLKAMQAEYGYNAGQRGNAAGILADAAIEAARLWLPILAAAEKGDASARIAAGLLVSFETDKALVRCALLNKRAELEKALGKKAVESMLNEMQ